MTEQSTSRTKQYWDYTIQKRVKYATGDYFTTFKDDPRLDGFTEKEIEAVYAAGVQWGEVSAPTWKNRAAFEAYQMLIAIFYTTESGTAPVDYEALKNRNLKLFGLSVNELHRTLFHNVTDDKLFDRIVEEYYSHMELTFIKTSGKSDGLQGLFYKTMATNIDNYIELRDVDGLFSWSVFATLCCSTEGKINELPEWHYECIQTGVWTFDAINSSKHRSEEEPCDLSRYIDGGMPDNMSNMLEYARQKFWSLTKRYSKEANYQPYKSWMMCLFGGGYLLYRYKHIEFLGPILTKNVKEDDDQKHLCYKVIQDPWE